MEELDEKVSTPSETKSELQTEHEKQSYEEKEYAQLGSCIALLWLPKKIARRAETLSASGNISVKISNSRLCLAFVVNEDHRPENFF